MQIRKQKSIYQAWVRLPRFLGDERCAFRRVKKP